MKNKTRMLLGVLLTLTLAVGLLPGMSATAYADVTGTVVIGDPTSEATHSYLPHYSLYEYSCSQQIYTADEIGTAGTIESITLWLKNTSSYANFPMTIYLKETDTDSFAGISAFESFTNNDIVYTQNVSITRDNVMREYTFELTTPFEYSGEHNLLLCFRTSPGTWSSGLIGKSFSGSSFRSIYAYRDGTPFDPTDLSTFSAANKGYSMERDVIRLEISSVPVTGVSLSTNTAQTINVGGTVSFTASVQPDEATDKTVLWSVGGTNAGAVTLYSDAACTEGNEVGTEATSTLTVYAKGLSVGSATVTATSNANSNKYATCAVTVRKAPVTGDTADFGLWAALLLAGLSGMGIALTAGKRRKARQ